MSLYQCQHCGCRENTVMGFHHAARAEPKLFDWKGREHLAGKVLCCACGPTHYKDGNLTLFGRWHGVFPRLYLPLGEFKTNAKGNLEHIATGSTDLRAFEVSPPPSPA